MAKVTVWYSQVLKFSEVIEYDTTSPDWKDHLEQDFDDLVLELPVVDPVDEEISIDEIHEGEV